MEERAPVNDFEEQFPVPKNTAASKHTVNIRNEKRTEARNKGRGDRTISRSTRGDLNPDANQDTQRRPGYSNDL